MINDFQIAKFANEYIFQYLPFWGLASLQ